MPSTSDSPEGFVVFGLITPESDFEMNRAFDRACDAFGDSGGDGPISTGGGDISIDPERLGLFAILVDGPQVAEESRQLAAELGDAPEAADVARCTRRVEFGFQFEDTRGEIFPEFERLLAVFRTFRGIIFLDPRNPVATLGGNFTPPPRRRKK